MDKFVALTLDGLTLGSVYALIALGYTLVYGVLKLLNFAHGDVFMVGSYIGFGTLNALGGATNLDRPAVARARPDHRLGDGRLRAARRGDRALRLPTAARGASNCAADQRTGRLVLPRIFDAAPLRRPVPRLQPVRRSGQSPVSQGVPHRQRQCVARPHHHHRLGIRADGRSLVSGQQDADGEGDACDVVRPRGRGDDGHRHRPGDRVHVRTGVRAGGSGRRAVRDPCADPGFPGIPRRRSRASQRR